MTAGETSTGQERTSVVEAERVTVAGRAAGSDQPAGHERGPVDGPELSGEDRPDVLDGPFTTRQLLRIDEALRLADSSTELVFTVYVGDLDEPVREHAKRLHAQLAEPARAILIAVSPNQRVLEIITGAEARRRIPDRDAKLAALSMVAAFGGGDLASGIVSGLDQLASRVRKRD